MSMVRQHTISDWGQEPDAKIQKARAAAEYRRSYVLTAALPLLNHLDVR